MAVVDVFNIEREKVGSIELNDAVFDTEVREHLFHEVVRAQRAARRSGTAKVKERGEVKATTAKAWKQKGTGRARQGNKGAVHWVGGGVVHGPRPRSYDLKVNKKVRKAAIRAALSRRQQEGALIILDAFRVDTPKTRAVADVLAKFESKRALIVDVENINLSKSARNLPSSSFLAVAGVNVYDVLRHDLLMLTKEAAIALQEKLA